MEPEAPAQRSWSSAAIDVMMVALALVSLAILWGQEKSASPELDRNLTLLDLGIVAIFIAEYGIRLRRAPDKWTFVRRNWYELPGMIPILPGMEGLAGIRALRLLRILRVLRLFGAIRRFAVFERAFDRFMLQSKLGYVAFFAFVIMAICAGLAYLVEPETFRTYGDSLWWAVVTCTTVGYGDITPRSLPGRLVAVVLMLLGVALIGTFAGTLGSFLVDRRFSGPTQAAPGPAADSPVPGIQIATELDRLSRLHTSGELTDEEYASAKRKLLG